MSAPPAIHVVPDERGDWWVQRDDEPLPLSEHGTETDAERAAALHAQRLGATEVIVHDRYGRLHRRSWR